MPISLYPKREIFPRVAHCSQLQQRLLWASRWVMALLCSVFIGGVVWRVSVNLIGEVVSCGVIIACRGCVRVAGFRREEFLASSICFLRGFARKCLVYFELKEK